MKWFQHQTHSHTDIALRDIISEFGLEGYGFYFICLELVGQQGANYRLNGAKSWKNALKNISGLDDKKLSEILKKLSELDLICPKSLENGELHIPKMKKYSDDYTKKQRRMSVHSTDKIPLDKIRIDKIRKDYCDLKNLSLSDFSKNDFGRTAKEIVTLIDMAKGDEALVTEAIKWVSKKGWVDWGLRAVINHWPEFMAEAGGIPEHLRGHLKK